MNFKNRCEHMEWLRNSGMQISVVKCELGFLRTRKKASSKTFTTNFLGLNIFYHNCLLLIYNYLVFNRLVYWIFSFLMVGRIFLPHNTITDATSKLQVSLVYFYVTEELHGLWCLPIDSGYPAP